MYTIITLTRKSSRLVVAVVVVYKFSNSEGYN